MKPYLVVFLVIALLVAVMGIAAGQLSPKMLAVLAGAVAGVLAAVPTAIVISHVTRHRTIARKHRAAWCKAEAEMSELRAQRLETLALGLPDYRHQLITHAHLEREIAAALNKGDLDRALELTRAVPELPEGMVASQTALGFALPTSTWPGNAQ